MKRLWLLTVTLAALLFVNNYAHALNSTDFTLALSAVEGEPKAETELTVTYLGQPICAETLLCHVEFDTEALSLVGITEPTLDGFCNVTVPFNGWADTCCVSTEDEGAIAPTGIVFKYRFVVSETAPIDETVITVTLTADDSTAQNSEIFTVLPKPSASTELISLSPSSGQLTPEFSTENSAYSLTVPSDVDKVTFAAEPADGATCKVNRTNLGKVGSTTDFKLTVTAADGKTKAVYTVAVHRAEASPSPAPTASSAAAQSSPTPQTTKAPSPSASTAETPTPTSTPKPTTSPVASQSSQGSPSSAEPSITAPISPTVTASPQYTQANTQTIALRGMGTDILPLAAALVVLLTAIGISKPLAHALATLITRKKRGRGEK